MQQPDEPLPLANQDKRQASSGRPYQVAGVPSPFVILSGLQALAAGLWSCVILERLAKMWLSRHKGVNTLGETWQVCIQTAMHVYGFQCDVNAFNFGEQCSFGHTCKCTCYGHIKSQRLVQITRGMQMYLFSVMRASKPLSRIAGM